MQSEQSSKLHIGCGKTVVPGFVNIDIIRGCDLQLDLNTDRLPFPDNSVDCVFSYHSLEHFDNYFFVMGEIWRVLRHSGTFLLQVPYLTLTEYNLVNPYHKRYFNEFSFDFFDPERLQGSANEDVPITFKRAWHRYHYMPGFGRVPEPLRTFCRRHFYNVVNSIDFGLYAIKPSSDPFVPPRDSAKTLAVQFDQIVSSRRPAPWAL